MRSLIIILFLSCSFQALMAQDANASRFKGIEVRFTQSLSDSILIRELGTNALQRRYLVYAPKSLPKRPVPVVFVFHGKGVNAEIMATTETHGRFDELADRDSFIVVYGNGLPSPSAPWEGPSFPHGGFFKGCLLNHGSEGVDISYVRQIIVQLESQFRIDRKRIYATGESAGGGMSFALAMEAPDLIAAIAPAVPLPFQPTGIWLHHCKPQSGFERISILMLAATDDPFIAYPAGSSKWYPEARYPGMETTRDVWLREQGFSKSPLVDSIPDRIKGDSYEKHSSLTSSWIIRSCYHKDNQEQEFCFLKAIGMGHRWPNPNQTPERLWEKFGKTNQDVDFADLAWDFFKKHPKR